MVMAIKSEYVGDAVYAIETDQNLIGLTVNDHRNPPLVYLEPETLLNLIKFAEKVWPGFKRYYL